MEKVFDKDSIFLDCPAPYHNQYKHISIFAYDIILALTKNNLPCPPIKIYVTTDINIPIRWDGKFLVIVLHPTWADKIPLYGRIRRELNFIIKLANYMSLNPSATWSDEKKDIDIKNEYLCTAIEEWLKYHPIGNTFFLILRVFVNFFHKRKS